MDLGSVRAREFSHLKTTYLDSAYLGPSPARALDAGRRAIDEQGDPSRLVYEEWREKPEPLRALAAELFGASQDDVAFVTSTTEIVNKIAQGLRLGRGDRIAVIEGDYPSIVLPWMLREQDGVAIDRLRPPERPPSAAWLDSALASGTRVLALSHVAFDTGARVDVDAIAALCARRSIFFVVDATQSLGAVAIDLAKLPGVSALAASCYKWLLGPYGSGLAVVRPELRDALAPRWIDWMKMKTAARADDLLRYTLETQPGARALDRGQAPAFIVTAMLRASLELFRELGPREVAARSRELADRLVLGLDRDRFELATPETARASIVSFRARDPAVGRAFGDRLARAHIKASVREGKLRVSPHVFNDESEIDRLLAVLAE